MLIFCGRQNYLGHLTWSEHGEITNYPDPIAEAHAQQRNSLSKDLPAVAVGCESHVDPQRFQFFVSNLRMTRAIPTAKLIVHVNNTCQSKWLDGHCLSTCNYGNMEKIINNCQFFSYHKSYRHTIRNTTAHHPTGTDVYKLTSRTDRLPLRFLETHRRPCLAKS